MKENGHPSTPLLLLVTGVALFACNPDGSTGDAGMDGGSDTSQDGGEEDTDTQPDASHDASGDSGETDTDTDTTVLDGDGSCQMVGSAFVNAVVSDTTVGEPNDLFDYNCTALDESGSDLAYQFDHTGTVAIRLTATLTNAPCDLDLFLLGEDCSKNSCVAYSAAGTGDEAASAIIQPSATLFVVVDGYMGAACSFDLLLTEEMVEVNCTGNIDDDGDGLTDCDDDDCMFETDCVQSCVPNETITCGHMGSHTTAGFSNTIEIYSFYSTSLSGPEKIFAFTASATGTIAEATLSNETSGQELLILADYCSSDAVAYAGSPTVEFAPDPAIPYFLIVDGSFGSTGSFEFQLTCREADCDDSLDNDDDGLTDCADDDCEIDLSCVATCDLLTADAGCASFDGGASSCYLLDPYPPTGFCHPAGDASVGDPCAAPADCIAGAICTPADICLMACDLVDDVPGCALGTCSSLGIDPLGVCW
jgi:hypothetical protein